MFKKIFLYSVFSFVFLISKAQSEIVDAINNFGVNYENEKIYIHFDKHSYIEGETIWFKLYLFSGLVNEGLSKTVYVDFYDDNNKSLAHLILPVLLSSAKGNFKIPDTLHSKGLHIIAYTKRMVSLNPDFVYKKDFNIISLSYKPKSENKIYNKISLKFYPEGGNYYNGISSKLAFKAINQQGNPQNLKGIIKNKLGKVVDSFATSHNGMGYLYFQPILGENYMAIYQKSNGLNDTVQLPIALQEGYYLSVKDNDDSFLVIIQRTPYVPENLQKIQLLVTQQYQTIYLATINLKSKPEVKLKISKEDMQKGIVCFTIFSNDLIPLEERIVFNSTLENPIIPEIYIQNKDLKKRGKNEYEIIVDDPSYTNLSVAITDANLNIDTSGSNIYTNVFVEQEIKGYIYKPDYYFTDQTAEKLAQLDLVMLTNGWRKYNWKQIFKQKDIPNQNSFDNDFLSIKGKVFGSNFNDKKSAQKQLINFIFLANDKSKKFFFIPVDSNSNFTINDLLFYDTCRLYYGFNKNTNEDAFLNFEKPSIALTNIPSFDIKKTPIILNYDDLYKNYTKLLESLNKENSATLLQEIVLAPKKIKSRLDELDDEYTSGFFKGGQARSFDLENDLFANGTDLYNYISGKIPGLTVQTNSIGVKTFNWRNEEVKIFLDGFEIPPDALQSVFLQNLAYIKVFNPPFFGTSNGAGGAIALYTKKGYSTKKDDDPNKGLKSNTFMGYTSSKEFYIPTLEELNNKLVKMNKTTLYWNPYILTDKKTRVAKIEFYNNDITQKFKIIIEGVSSNKQLIHFEKIIQ